MCYPAPLEQLDGTSSERLLASRNHPTTSLTDNGGPTQTIALLKGSPAMNAIPQAENGRGTGITTDQRG
jgi:hypothetical protein